LYLILAFFYSLENLQILIVQSANLRIMTSIYLTILLCIIQYTRAEVIQSLTSIDGGINWIVINSNKSISIPAIVPGSIHLDLLNAGIIEEPYVSMNVDLLSWIKNESYWIWRANFIPTIDLLSADQIQLIVEGIDTIAQVYLNGYNLFNSSNSFIQTSVDVPKSLLISGNNEILIQIKSPTWAALAFNASCSGFCPSSNWGPELNRSSYDQAFNYIRKPGCHFGWDFAPNFATSGIWRKLYLRGFNSAILDDVTVVTTPLTLPVSLNEPSVWNTSIQAFITAKNACNVTVSVSIYGINGGASVTTASISPGQSTITLVLLVSANAWWPNGLGKPTLYNANVTVSVDDKGEASFLGISSQTFAIGFRSIVLKRPSMGVGELMYFEVNGHSHFLKGANFVPPDAFPTRHSTRALFAPQIYSFFVAGFTGLRVWGGGHPLDDSFYELAQENGMLIWHEMPYACSGYPTGGVLLSDASNEAKTILLRLQKFGIAIWGGNNEIGQIQGKNYPPGSDGSSNYSSLFFNSLGETITKLDPSRAYVPTSPGSGLETPLNPISFPGMTADRGDMHVYVYDGNCLDPTRYPRARAATEFGWQSYSTFISLAELIAPTDFDFWSPPIQRRDTHGSQQPQVILFHNIGMNWLIPGYNGSSKTLPGDRDTRLTGSAQSLADAARAANTTSQVYTRRSDGTFILPTDALGIVPLMSAFGGVGSQVGTIFRDTLFMTQVSHAACLKTEAESYRREQSSCQKDGQGCTSTMLYWMANELWPAATKSSIEWSGRWKATHYEAARGFMAPILVSPWSVPLNSSMPASIAPFGITLAAHPPASLLGAVPSGLLRLTCWSWRNGKLGDYDHFFSVKSWPSAWVTKDLVNSAGGSVNLFNSTLATALSLCGCSDPIDCVLTVSVFNSTSADPEFLLAENWLNPVPLNDVKTMRNPQLQITNVESFSTPGSFLVTITAAVLPVQNVWLESLLCCGFFSSNNFLMSKSPLTLLYSPNADTRGWIHAPSPGSEFNITSGQFAASLSIWSLYDTVDGYSTLAR
jgi:hypothetical protein